MSSTCLIFNNFQLSLQSFGKLFPSLSSSLIYYIFEVLIQDWVREESWLQVWKCYFLEDAQISIGLEKERRLYIIGWMHQLFLSGHNSSSRTWLVYRRFIYFTFKKSSPPSPSAFFQLHLLLIFSLNLSCFWNLRHGHLLAWLNEIELLAATQNI